MLTKMDIKVDIDPIIKQVEQLDFDRSLAINYTDGTLLNGPYYTKPEFAGTPLGDCLEKVGNLGEARLLKIDWAQGYTAHADPDDRVHLAITTTPYSYLVDLDNEKLYHVPVDGEFYMMDTGLTHTACNFGAKPRIHLNIRVALPVFTKPGYSLRVEGGDYDWKQEIYMTTMKFFNYAIKDKRITGFEKVDDREVLLNCDPIVLEPYINELEQKGFIVKLTDVL